jgi:hydrogenase maturation protein HypF
MKNLLQIKDTEIEFIACDLHPEFITTKFGKELSTQYNVPLYPIQHHYAHIVGLMSENNIQPEEEIIGISTDGVGYGDDGKIWGGEVLLSSYNEYRRIGHLEYQPMIGGDRCTKYPARMLASILLNVVGIEEALKIFNRMNLQNDLEYKSNELTTLISQFGEFNHQSSQNIPLTSSTGRIFDAISYILGVTNLRTYRGEPAMRLEGLASYGNPENIDLKIGRIKKNGLSIIDSSTLILDILDLVKDKNNRRSDIAAKFHTELALCFADIAKEFADTYGINKIGLSGGVAYNYLFSRTIKKDVELEGFTFLEHELVAPGDAGISIGQLIGGLFKHLNNK